MSKKQNLEVVKIVTDYFITAVFPSSCLSLYLKPVFVLVQTSDGEVVFASTNRDEVMNTAWILDIPWKDVTII